MKLPVSNIPGISEAFRIIEKEDSQNLKRNRDIEMNKGRLILTSPNGTRYALSVDNAGVLSTVVV